MLPALQCAGKFFSSRRTGDNGNNFDNGDNKDNDDNGDSGDNGDNDDIGDNGDNCDNDDNDDSITRSYIRQSVPSSRGRSFFDLKTVD